MNRLSAANVLLACLMLGACAVQERPELVKAPAMSSEPRLQQRAAVKPSVMQRFNRANAALEKQQWSAARDELQQLVVEQAHLSGPRLNLALVYQQLGEAEQADTLFRETLAVNPENLAAYNQYGIFLREQGRFAEAEAIYLKALEVREPHADTHRNLGVLYDMYMGDQQRALQHYHRYQALTSANDKLVSSWIIDLQRQLLSMNAGEQQ
jgi:Tfp pilus assembly protein PilF